MGNQTKNCQLIPFAGRDLEHIVEFHLACAFEAFQLGADEHAGNLLIVGYDALAVKTFDHMTCKQKWSREAALVAEKVYRELRDTHLNQLVKYAERLACGPHHYEPVRGTALMLEFCQLAVAELDTACTAAGSGAMINTQHKKGRWRGSR